MPIKNKMAPQTFYTLAGAAVGFISALWFSTGALLTNAGEIIEAADDSFDASPDTAGALITQAAQYSAGGLLLLLSFGLQVVAALADSVPLSNPTPIEVALYGAHPGTVLAVTLSLALVASYPIYQYRKRQLRAKVEVLKNKK